MKCLLVDDEPLAIQLLESHIKRIDSLTVVRTFGNPLDALSYLRNYSVDLLFLDIQMPKINGISLLGALPNKPKVILTTAHRDYAFDAFNLDVVDYLLKPISFERFLRAVAKATGHHIQDPVLAQEHKLLHDFEDAYIYVRQDKEMIKVFLKDIQYIESLRDYVRIVTVNQQIVTYNKISYLEKKLPENKFFRIHRSFIVALDRIATFTPLQVKLDQHIIPIGRVFKNETIRALNRNNLFESNG